MSNLFMAARQQQNGVAQEVQMEVGLFEIHWQMPGKNRAIHRAEIQVPASRGEYRNTYLKEMAEDEIKAQYGEDAVVITVHPAHRR